MSLLQVATASQLEQQDKAREQAKFATTQPVITDKLAAHVRSLWTAAKTDKAKVQERMNACLRARNGVYSQTKLEQIKSTGGTTAYMAITGSKCRAAKGWLEDLFSPVGEKPFSLAPTPIADLPPNLEQELVQETIQGAMQLGLPLEVAEELALEHEDRLKMELKLEAEGRAEKAEDYIEDILVEGCWREEFNSFIDDLVTYPAAILKAPVFKARKKLKWTQDEQGKHIPKIVSELCREVRRVSPYDIYPAPSASNLRDSWLFEHIRFTAEDLTSLRHAKGYNAQNIAMVLREYRMVGYREWCFNDNERHKLEGKNSTSQLESNLIDALEWSGKLQGQMLLDWGMDPATIPDPLEEYPVSVVVVGNYTIRALVNPDPTGRPNYYKATWDTVPNGFWGRALPEVMADCQDNCNAAIRAVINNAAIGSGPQIAVDVAAMPAGTDVTKLSPWKLWFYDSTKTDGRVGISFFQPEIKSNELLGIYEKFAAYADEISGLPSYAYGSDQGAGAAKTASGLSMLMNAASKTIKAVVRNIDINVIEPIVSALYVTIMLDPTVPDDVKGDVKIKARGSDSLIHKEAAVMRQQELLQLTGNPIDMQVIGLDGRRELLKSVLKSGELPVDLIIPTKEELEQDQAAQMQEQPEQGEQ